MSWAACLLPVASHNFQTASQPGPQCLAHTDSIVSTSLQALCAAWFPFSETFTDTSAHLHREDLPQGKEEGVHVDVRVFAEAVGLGVVLEVQVVPPAGRCPLQKHGA